MILIEQPQEAVRNMPDFSLFIMDDGCGMILILNGNVSALIPEKEVEECEKMRLLRCIFLKTNY